MLNHVDQAALKLPFEVSKAIPVLSSLTYRPYVGKAPSLKSSR